MWRTMVLVLFCSAAPLYAVEFDVTLSEPADRAATVIQWPITVGVPFAEGAIAHDTPVSLGETPVQTQTLAPWRTGSGSPKWVLLDYQQTIGGEAPGAQRVVTGQPPAAPKQPVNVTRDGDAITVSTGVSQFTIDTQNFDPFAQFAYGPYPMVEQTEVYWVDRNGERYTARAFNDNKVEVELAGPMRAVVRCEGWYAHAETGEKLMRYQMRIAAFAGLPVVRMYHTLIWTADDSIEMREFGVSFKLPRRAHGGTAGVEGGEPLDVSGQVVQFVQEHRAFARVIDDADNTPIAPLAGWVRAGSLAVALRDMAMQLPKAITVNRDWVHVQLWAPQAGFMGMRASDRMQSPTLPDSQTEWKRFNEYSPQGAAKTHEIWLWPAAFGDDPAAVNDLVQRPVFAAADPVYMASTDAIPGIRAAMKTPAAYQFIEDGLDRLFRYIAEPSNRSQDFDMWNFGDVHLFTPSGWRTWDGNGYNWSQVPWLMYYRSGVRHYRMHGERNARHVMDVDICHHGPLQNEAHHKALGFKHMYSPLHWAWGPVWDNFHTHPQYLLHYHRLTGYERAADVLELMAASSKANTGTPTVEKWFEGTSIVSRTQYGQINPKAVFYEFTGDPYFLDSAKGWADLALANRDEQGNFQHNTFWHFFHRGLVNVYRYTQDAAIRDALLKTVEAFRAKPASGFDAPYYGREAMTSFAFAANETGNAQYLQYPVWRIMEQTRMAQDGDAITPWEGGLGYTAMPRTVTSPFFDGALPVLGAWHDAGYPAIESWPGNMMQFGSQSVEVDAFRSRMLIHARKEVGRAAVLDLRFKSGNLGRTELLTDKRMEVRITDPTGAQRVVELASLTPDPLRFDADAPAGVYRIEILGEQDVFWLTPTSDLPGLVIEYENGEVPFACRYEPSRIYFHMAGDADALTLSRLGTHRKVILPVRIVGPAQQELGRMDEPTDGAKVIAVPEALRGATLSLAKGYCAYVPWDANLPRLKLDGAQPYVALQAEQWFNPSAF